VIGHHLDGYRRQTIIGEQDGHEVGRRRTHARVDRPREARPFVDDEIDARIGQVKIRSCGELVLIVRLDHDEQAPVGPCLVAHGLQCLGQEERVMVPEGHEDGNHSRRL
jgi:hypothetical protein